MKDSIQIKGRVKIWQGESLICDDHNLVVKVGLDLFARLVMQEEGALLPDKFQLGNNGVLSTLEMTELQGMKIAECPATVVRRGNVLSWTGSFVFDSAEKKTCREIVLVNSEAEAKMMARFIPIQQFDLVTGTPIRINWEIIIGG